MRWFYPPCDHGDVQRHVPDRPVRELINTCVFSGSSTHQRSSRIYTNPNNNNYSGDQISSPTQEFHGSTRLQSPLGSDITTPAYDCNLGDEKGLENGSHDFSNVNQVLSEDGLS